METQSDTFPTLAYCGLHCGACGAFKSGKCAGCRQNAKLTWCKVRACCIEHGHTTCADCQEHSDTARCKTFNVWIARLFGLVFNSDRGACIRRIREVGPQAFVDEMAAGDRRTLPRRGKAKSGG